MFYHPHEGKLAKIFRHFILLVGTLMLFFLLVFSLFDSGKIPQRQVVVDLDLTNKINICQAEDEKIFKKSFFDF